MGRNHPLRAVAVALLCALMVLFAPGLRAQTVTNTANANWMQSDVPFSTASNSVSFVVLKKNTPPIGHGQSGTTPALGLVFDSEDGTMVSGAKVSIIDVATGQPATVFAADGVTPWPSTVYTGQSVTDGAGLVYQLSPGEYCFPLLAPGQYRIVVEPPNPYRVPSAADIARLAGLTRPDGSPLMLSGASYGSAFTISNPQPIKVDIPADRPPTAVTMTKSASRVVAQPGDVVFYTVTVNNPDRLHAKRDVTLVDTPSPLLRLRPGSVRIDGVSRPGQITIPPDGKTLTVRLGNIPVGTVRTVTYAMTVRPNAATGQALNKAVATDYRGTTTYAGAVVRIEPDGLTARMTLIGRVTDNGCSADASRAGIPGVRVMLEDGSFAVTDHEGRYHFDGLVPGEHIAQVMDMTLPEGGRFVDCSQSTRSAGSAISRFVSGRGGSLAVADFYAELPQEQQAAAELESKQIPELGPDRGNRAQPVGGGVSGDMPPLDPHSTASEASAPADPDGPVSDRIAAGAETDWLALGDGPIDFLFPVVDYNPRAPALRVVIRYRPGQKVELATNGKPVAEIAFDGDKVAANHAWAVGIWRGIPLDGDVTHLTAIVRNPDGSVAATLARDVHFTQTPAQVQIVREKTVLVADGRTKPVIALRVLDRNGRPVHAGISGDISLNAPYESAEAVDAMQSRALSGLGRATPHWTVKGDDGIALVELAPTMVSGALQLDLTFIDGQQRRRQTLNEWVVPGKLKWTLVGLAEGSVGARTIADAMERTGNFSSDIGKRGRVAFYAKGRVLGRYILTLAYDSAKQRDDQQLLGAIDPKAYYTVFADGSNRRFDAASREKLYVRIEARAFNALFGDFSTDFNQTQLARYQRTITGVKAEGGLGGFHAEAYGARVSSTHRHDEIQGGGISGPYALSGRAIVANSETVVLQVRDRFRSEIIVNSTTLTRFIDYDIDMLSGTISFKQPILSRDVSLNPQFIVIDYDVDPTTDTDGSLNGGARTDWTSRNGGLRIGATAITDKGDAARTNMVAIDLRARPNATTELRAEASVSQRNGSNSVAWLAEAEHHDKRIDLLAYAHSVDAKFGVGQLNGPEIGRRKMGVDARMKLTAALSINATAWYDESLTDPTHREALQVKGEYRTKGTDLHLGISTILDHLADGTNADSTVLDVGATKRLFDNKLQMDASTSFGLGKTESIDLPARHLLSVRYALSPRIKLIGSYEIASGAAIDARTARVGFELQPWTGGRIISAVEQQNIAEYGPRSFAAFGLTQSFEVTRHLTIDGTIDANKVLGGFDISKVVNPAQPVVSGGLLGGNGTLTEDYTALTLGASWRAGQWTATLRGEWRDGEFARRKGATLGAIRQLGEGSMVGSGVSWTHANGSDGSITEVFDSAIAVANRPANSTFAFLTKVGYRSDMVVGATAGMAGIGGATGTTALIVTGDARSRRLIGSFSANWSPRSRDNGAFVQRSEFGFFAAGRYNFDRYDGYNLAGTTLLTGLDAHLAIGRRVAVGGSFTLRGNLADHTTNFAIGPSASVVPARNMLLSLGYNVTGFRDRDFTADRSTNRGVFATLKLKFDTSTFGFLGLGRR
ncbi:hypothetical protein U1769_14405 [Sphingomonas sp. ZT3P38]|uniref:hypothetical protein n=1 Tax=Parasphingomonas zepuensis TaxID=3096161 RepID=UPI002FCB2B1B